MRQTKNYSLETLIEMGYEPKTGDKFNNYRGDELSFIGFETVQLGATSLIGEVAIKKGYDEDGRKFGKLAILTNNKKQKIFCSLNAITKLIEIEISII